MGVESEAQVRAEMILVLVMAGVGLVMMTMLD